MAILAASLFTGVIVAALSIWLQARWAGRRHARFHNLELIPNILLTRYPIFFVGRNRSLFRISGDFFEMPAYAREHGFQVEEVELRAGSAIRSQQLAVDSLLNSLNEKVHLIFCAAFCDLAYELALDSHPRVASITVLGRGAPFGQSLIEANVEARLRPAKIPLHERPDLQLRARAQHFEIERTALNHLVALAESDLR